VTKELLEVHKANPGDNQRLVISGLGKKFNRNWVFKDIHIELKSGQFLAVSGGNGSGKSTFLQCVLGSMGSTTGQCSLYTADHKIHEDSYAQNFSIAAPYSGIYEDFTLRETVDFHIKFKPLASGLDASGFAELIGLMNHIDKPVHQFSSGMKQRVKLGLALYSEVSVILLDEPCSHLDAKGIQWYKEQVSIRKENRIVLVASNNMETETFFCQQTVQMGIGTNA
jgi:ABC-type multidrug transport system ATPase subunit